MDVNAYFKSYKNYFWQWEEGIDVIAIPNGNTIAYKEHIIEILQDFSTQGFPPFGALLALIVATNPNSEASLSTIYAMLKQQMSNHNPSILDESIVFLNLLAEVPKKYKTGPNRTLLLKALFEDIHHRILSPKNSKRILDVFSSHAFHPGQIIIKEDFYFEVFYRDFRIINLLADKFVTIEHILAKIASLPEIPEELDLPHEIQAEPAKKDFIEELIDDYKTFPTGALIKRIWSGLNIPLHSALPSQQPLGGVSDLTNKGTFDKLLISEFANDDLIFMSRIANNEALYIQREIPPVTNNLQRVILIDVSLKNWGTPKIIAYAIAIAIARHPKTDIVCTAFAFGDSFYPLSLDSVENVIESLQVLESSLNGAKGLEAYFKEYPDTRNREIFLITEASTLKQTAMLKVLNDYFSAINYWIHTDAEGNIDLYKKQQKSKNHIQHIQLPLKELWVREAKPVKNPTKTLANFPILFRELLNPKKVLEAGDGELFLISNDNALLKFADSKEKVWKNGTGYLGNKGWLLIYEDIPHTFGPLEIGIIENGDYVLLVGNQQTKEITLINISTNKQYTIPFPEWYKGEFVFFEKWFYYLNIREGWGFSLPDSTDKTSTENKILKVKIVKELHDEFIQRNIVEKRQKVLEGITKHLNSGRSILQRFNEVYITAEGNLVFNKHELHVTNGIHLKLTNMIYRTSKKTEAHKTQENIFTFNDGSTVETIRTGMIILRSSDTSIPAIYFPSALDSTLGIATADEFAGNTYYHKEYQESSYNAVLTDTGTNLLHVVKILQQQGKVSLKMAREIASTAPALIPEKFSLNEANSLKAVLEKQGAEVTIKPDNIWDEKFPIANKIITLPEFFEKHVKAFINTILNYGTNH